MNSVSKMSESNEDIPETSIIIPTYNEAPNIPVLLERIKKVMENQKYEIIFVDDNSPDNTPKVIEEHGEKNSLKHKIKVIIRKNEKGLASAVVEGFKHANGKYLIVMDADLQHPPEKIPEIIEALRKGSEIVIATRYKGGRDEGLSFIRKMVSKTATLIAKMLLPQTRKISDPMTGFFGLRRSVIQNTINNMKPMGYKILLEVLVRGHYDPRKIKEISYTFHKRHAGKSKLGAGESIQYLLHVLRLNDYRILKFTLVGISGIGVNEGVLWLLHYVKNIPLYLAGAISIEASILNNFSWNTLFTFRKEKVKDSLWKRCLKYHLATILGVIINYSTLLVLSYIVGIQPLISNLIGILLGFITNYTLSEHYVWQRAP